MGNLSIGNTWSNSVTAKGYLDQAKEALIRIDKNSGNGDGTLTLGEYKKHLKNAHEFEMSMQDYVMFGQYEKVQEDKKKLEEAYAKTLKVIEKYADKSGNLTPEKYIEFINSKEHDEYLSAWHNSVGAKYFFNR